MHPLVYPMGQSELTLYEDDGLTPQCREGYVAATPTACSAGGMQVELVIQPRGG